LDRKTSFADDDCFALPFRSESLAFDLEAHLGDWKLSGVLGGAGELEDNHNPNSRVIRPTLLSETPADEDLDLEFQEGHWLIAEVFPKADRQDKLFLYSFSHSGGENLT